MRPTTGFRPSTRFAAATPVSRRDGPAARNTRHERTLANAIGGLWLVELRCEGEKTSSLFAPHALFRTAAGGVSVSGTRLADPEQPIDASEPEILVVGRIATLRITADAFTPDPRFERSSPMFEGGVICSV